MQRSTTLLLALSSLFCLLTFPSLAADVPLGDVLMGKVAPLTIKFGDITPQWSQFTLAPGRDQAPNLQLDMEPLKIDQSFYNSYFTKGQTVSFGGEIFLLAYSKPNPVKSMLKDGMYQMFGRYNHGEYDPMEKIISFISLNEDTQLNLCLLNMKDSGNILDIHPIDIKAEIFPSEEERADLDPQSESRSNLWKLVLAALVWSNANEERLPTLNSEKDWLKELAVETKLTKNPVTGEIYHANAAISGKHLGTIEDPASTPIFYENTPWPDGKRAVAFVDGHVEFLNEGTWKELQERWNLK